MFRTSPVHHQERFVQAVFADLVCGTTVRTTRHVQLQEGIKLGLILEDRLGDREQSADQIIQTEEKGMEKITTAIMNFLNSTALQ